MKKSALLAVVLAAASFAASSQTVTVTGGPSVNAIGDEIGSQYDQFQFNNGSFQAQLGSFDITSYTFTVGPNCYTCGTHTGSASFDVSFMSLHDTIVVPFTWYGGDSDTIAFDSTTHDYLVNGQAYAFTTDAFSLTAAPSTVTGELTGSIAAVPEPSTYALMLAGFAAIGFFSRRKNNA